MKLINRQRRPIHQHASMCVCVCVCLLCVNMDPINPPMLKTKQKQPENKTNPTRWRIRLHGTPGENHPSSIHPASVQEEEGWLISSDGTLVSSASASGRPLKQSHPSSLLAGIPLRSNRCLYVYGPVEYLTPAIAAWGQSATRHSCIIYKKWIDFSRFKMHPDNSNNNSNNSKIQRQRLGFISILFFFIFFFSPTAGWFTRKSRDPKQKIHSWIRNKILNFPLHQNKKQPKTTATFRTGHLMITSNKISILNFIYIYIYIFFFFISDNWLFLKMIRHGLGWPLNHPFPSLCLPLPPSASVSDSLSLSRLIFKQKRNSRVGKRIAVSSETAGAVQSF